MTYLPFHPSLLFNTNNYLTCLLAIISVVGDYTVTHTKLHIFRAFFDNATHATIGALSWLIVCVNFKNRSHLQSLVEIGLCTGIASVIDIDHFISARSFNLKDATSLSKRPPLHCSTFPLVICSVLLLLGYFFHIDVWKRVSLIVLTAFMSHHTRDATRRGYWFYPFGSTPPIPYYCYVALTCFIPYFIGLLYKLVKIDDSPRYSIISKGSVI